MKPDLSDILVDVDCSACGAHIAAPYSQIKVIGMFVCGCGTRNKADMADVSTRAILGLMNGSSPAVHFIA